MSTPTRERPITRPGPRTRSEPSSASPLTSLVRTGCTDPGPDRLAAGRRDRGGDRGVEVVRPDQPRYPRPGPGHLAAHQGRAGRRVIAIDGKAVRGAKGKNGKAPHLVAALAHGIGAVLGQVAVDARSNEIPAVRDLLTTFADLAGAVITIDAMHTQSDTAQAILARHAGYVMTVKANMAALYKQLKKLPWKAIPASWSRRGATTPRTRRG